jgi:hypothetical protein
MRHTDKSPSRHSQRERGPLLRRIRTSSQKSKRMKGSIESRAPRKKRRVSPPRTARRKTTKARAVPEKTRKSP